MTRERPRLQLHNDGLSMAKQSFKDECDINTIMAQYRANGLIDHVNTYGGRYGFLPTESDFHANLQSVMDAQDAFASLPSKIRTKFENDPAKFLGWVMDPSNKDEILKLGLGEKPYVKADLPAEPAPAQPENKDKNPIAADPKDVQLI